MSNKIKRTFFYIARTFGVFALFRFLTRSKLRIVCYHGGAIGDESKYNAKLFFSRHTFEQRLQWLQKKKYNVMPLDDAILSAQGTGKFSHLSTVITFDDGWYSTASELIPVLGKLNMPSTLYLCTSHFLEGTPVTTVTTRYIIWKSPFNSVTLKGFDSNVDGQHSLAESASREQLAKKIVDWVESSVSRGASASKALEQFAESVGVTTDNLELASRRFQYMTGQELLKLKEQGCSIELHGHIHNYPKGNPTALRDDLKQCSDAIQSLGLPKPKHYCYPSGSFDSDAPMTLSKLDVVSATTCVPGLISKVDNTQRYFLPRFLDGGDVSMLEFEAEMSGFSEFLRRCTGRAARAV